ncbi:MAG: HD domain-containing protein [Desulfovibrio sp.]|nr:HD domain-containing protein [Desulfovibrio sp.]MBQ4126000.1 HD domain-containing protein [Desulfovibrio sp.]
MNLSTFDNKCVRITTVDGESFEDLCNCCHEECNEHEFGRPEPCLQMLSFLFFPREIAQIASLGGHSGPHGSFSAPFCRPEEPIVEELIVEDDIDSIKEVLFSEEQAPHMLNCLETRLRRNAGSASGACGMDQRRCRQDGRRKAACRPDISAGRRRSHPLTPCPGQPAWQPRAGRHEDPTMEDTSERLKRQMAFALEIDKEKNIFRQTHLSGRGRSENDAEHAWHMAIMAYLLREHANEPVDIAKVILMCLIHDIVEIDAGDTYAYDAEGLKTQKAREDAAKERIFSLLPEDQKQELLALFDEFEASETPEARYAHAVDNLQPLMLNDCNDGCDWRAHGVSAEQVYRRQRKVKLGSERLFGLIDQIIQNNIKKGNIKP